MQKAIDPALNASPNVVWPASRRVLHWTTSCGGVVSALAPPFDLDQEGLERYRDSLGTRPRVYHKNLHRWEKAVVGCSVVFGDSDECAEGASVTIEREGSIVGCGTPA